MCADDGTRAAAEPRPPGDDEQHAESVTNGRIALAELIEHGLSRQPACIAGIWLREVRALLCRSHASASILQRLGVDVDQLPGDALVMTGGHSTEKALGIWCPACRGDVETDDEAVVVTLYPTDHLEVRS